MIFTEHPGNWQVFLKRKDIISLPLNEARKQYLIEQQGFNAAASSAAAASAASAASSGGLVKTARIAANKGYAQSGYSKSTISNTEYETFYYGTSPSQRVTANKGYPIWEIQTGKKRNSRGIPTPSDFAYGYCIYDSDNYVWFLTNDPTVEDWQDSSVYATGPGQGVQWGDYQIVGSTNIVSVRAASNSAFPIVYYDDEEVLDNGGFLYKFYQTPVSYNKAPVYFDPFSEVIYAYGNFLDIDDDYGNGINAELGLGWNVMELSDENFYTAISNIGTTDQAGGGYFSSSMPPSPDNPLGTANNQGEDVELFKDPNNLAITYETDLLCAQVGAVSGDWLGTYSPVFDGSNNLILNDGRPQWKNSNQYTVKWEKNIWIMRNDEGIVISYLTTSEISPDGYFNGKPPSGTIFQFYLEFPSP